MIKANELRNMTIDEIRQKIDSLKKTLFAAKTEAMSGRIEKPHMISDMKKDIARCETVIKEKLNAKQAQA